MTEKIDAVKKEKLLECINYIRNLIEQLPSWLFKNELLERINYIRNFIEELPTQKNCASCLQWDEEEKGCMVSGGQTPPEHIQKNGCPSWVTWDDIPF